MFNAAMARRGSGQVAALLTATDLSGASTHRRRRRRARGHAGRPARALPALTGVVADRPAVAAEADGRLRRRGSGRPRARRGRPTSSSRVPAGGDVYFHRQRAARLGRRRRRQDPAHRPGGDGADDARLLVVEHVLDAPGRSAERATRRAPRRPPHAGDVRRPRAHAGGVRRAPGRCRLHRVRTLAATSTDWNVLEARPAADDRGIGWSPGTLNRVPDPRGSRARSRPAGPHRRRRARARRARPSSRWCSSSTGSSTPATPPRSRPGTWSSESGGGRVVATFEVDEFHDYRARRPAMSFVRDHYEQYDAPRLVVRLLADDSAARRTCCCTGPEPDNQLGGLRASRSAHVVERFGVSRVIGAGRGADGGAAHPADRDHPPRQQPRPAGRPTARGAASCGSRRSAQALLELRLGEWGHDAMGFVAHIPHYLAQLDYPQASVTLLEPVERGRRLAVDLTDLREAARERDEVEIATYLAANAEVREVVAGARAAVRRVRARRGGAATACSPSDEPHADGGGDRRGSSSSSWPASTDPTTAGAVAPDAVVRRGARRAPRPRDPRHRPLPGHAARHRPAARLRRPGRRPGADRRRSAPSTPALEVHSLHAYFLRPGDTDVPIIYDVERIRDGRSFETRRVVARQHGRPIFYLTANFQRPEEGFDHQDAMPEVPGPDEGLDLRASSPSSARGDTRPAASSPRSGPRSTPATSATPRTRAHPARRGHRAARRGPSSGSGSTASSATTRCCTPAAFTYASDLTLLGATLVPHGVHDRLARSCMPASLDHTIWFHRPFRADEWWLYDQWSPSAPGRSRARARPGVHRGRPLVATVAQEGLIRPRG